MAGDSPPLLGMSDIELLDNLKITYELVGEKQADRIFDSQTIQPFNGSSFKVNTGQWIKTDNVDEVDANSIMSNYFRSSINRAADKRASKVLMQCIHNVISDVFKELAVLKAHLAYR